MRRRRLPLRPAQADLASWALAILPALAVLAGGWAHRWVADDAYIDFRVVANVMSGHGAVFNVGERVEAYTSPLWVGLLALARTAVSQTDLPWAAVVLGLALTATGFLLGARACQRFAQLRDVTDRDSHHPKYRLPATRLVVPAGLVAMCALDSTWDFATSGLETGLVFAWESLSWWLLVRAAERHRGATVAGFVFGLGILIRPDLGLVTIVLMLGLGYMIQSPTWREAGGRWRRWAKPLCSCALLPLAYELWRMAYFAVLVPNTALAKSAATTQWHRGLSYLTDFASSGYLWIPIALMVLGFALHSYLLRTAERRGLMIVLAVPVTAGALDALYVVAIGGDFMHARMLMPALFLIAMTFYCDVITLLEAGVVALVALWAIVVGTNYRYASPATGTLARLGIVDERGFWIADTGNPHPVTLSEFSKGLFAQDGRAIRLSVETAPPLGSGRYLVLDSLSLVQRPGGPTVPGEGRLPVRVVAPEGSIGIIGAIAGPSVYVFDVESLANPIGSHLSEVGNGRAGHTKTASLVWMLARFSTPGSALPPGVESSVIAAREALGCGDLAHYLSAVTRPLTFGTAMSNIVHSVGFTSFSFNPDPMVARRQLCANTAAG